ncbi:MAG TPA: hypothetical protein P5096_03140 [Patescibacteria group bacterium]|nr:hypothetical protein [Patescibacteria group bacterium]
MGKIEVKEMKRIVLFSMLATGILILVVLMLIRTEKSMERTDSPKTGRYYYTLVGSDCGLKDPEWIGLNKHCKTRTLSAEDIESGHHFTVSLSKDDLFTAVGLAYDCETIPDGRVTCKWRSGDSEEFSGVQMQYFSEMDRWRKSSNATPINTKMTISQFMAARRYPKGQNFANIPNAEIYGKDWDHPEQNQP